jgi:hypothetical protein
MFPGSNTVARDASGNQISLLNDNPVPQTKENPTIREPILTSAASDYPVFTITTSYPSISLPSAAPTPKMPGFLRSDTYHWQGTTRPGTHLSLGLVLSLEHGMPPSYTASWLRFAEGDDLQDEHLPFYPCHPGHQQHVGPLPPHIAVRRGSAYSNKNKEDSYARRSILEKKPKRYSCRFWATHGCNKTFTTSGHASRHSKIHTAEKAVACMHPSCQKKFTRVDNMKEHLKTHYKGKV